MAGVDLWWVIYNWVSFALILLRFNNIKFFGASMKRKYQYNFSMTEAGQYDSLGRLRKMFIFTWAPNYAEVSQYDTKLQTNS